MVRERGSRDPETTFGAYMHSLWDKRRMTQSEFARRVRRDPGYIQYVRQGKRLPPDEATIWVWCDVLDLNEKESEMFLDLAALERTPERIRRKYTRVALTLF